MDHPKLHYRPSEEEIAQYHEDGFLIVRGLLSKTEMDLLGSEIEKPDGVTKYAFERDDGMGLKTRLALWNYPGDDLTGHVSRNARIVESMAALAGGEVYHYHTKLTMKEARPEGSSSGGGGAWNWHADYGYWVNNGCPRGGSAMGTVMIAVDRCTPENGCLEVLRGSHKKAPIKHNLVGEQTGADMDAVREVMKEHELVQVELEVGDACFFNSDLLHHSAQNTSPHRRYCFLVSFNRADNNPLYRHHHPQYTKLEVLPDDSILKADPSIPVDPAVKDFMVPASVMVGDKAVKVAELWGARNGPSSGVQMTTTAAVTRYLREGGAEDLLEGLKDDGSKEKEDGAASGGGSG